MLRLHPQACIRRLCAQHNTAADKLADCPAVGSPEAVWGNSSLHLNRGVLPTRSASTLDELRPREKAASLVLTWLVAVLGLWDDTCIGGRLSIGGISAIAMDAT
mmetsp:Transcript_25422/g.77137  ORF Transcript_25422/g.77137 Transcript_25422/m.77137 type:complete len:104 (+) Transcript_25422:116-427(+)